MEHPDLVTRFRAGQTERLAARAALPWPRRLVGKIAGLITITFVAVLIIAGVILVGVFLWYFVSALVASDLARVVIEAFLALAIVSAVVTNPRKRS